MPAKLFPGTGALYKNTYVKTGAFRPPKKGEVFLSGAIPEAYRATFDMSEARHILRQATEEEIRCTACGQRLPHSREP